MFGVPETDSQTLAQVLQEDPSRYRLIDVRSPGEWVQGVIEGAELVPLHLIPLQMEQWRDERPILFYCRSGARSAQACAYLMSRGHNRVVNLRGGIMDWARNGLPLVRPDLSAASG